ncbi:MAG TPA: SGNH/GDSL hydrolase family protein [Thermoanaerobaculia bacterium]|nr:SGNH/GDSL hydrolase family protein [Thermoanaerobaculia bacterium]HUM31211.1 SGNH/GDSL hydrolase family protein [Thermoanaerobaculia bacterium]HXK69553.1 SGNH/GDSL hydrolase family protein [Thermoanaerobaculia bacterium]
MKRRTIQAGTSWRVLVAVFIFMGLAGWCWSQAIIIDHTCTDISKIPSSWLEQAKQLTLHFAHTSHGSQIITGILSLEELHPQYSVAVNESDTPGLPPVEIPPALRIYDGNPGTTYVEPENYWYGIDGLNATRSVAATGDYNYSMWSWCGQLSWYDVSEVQGYLAAMNQLEQEFPSMRFIYMTGHLDGSGTDGLLNQLNDIIRQYCRDHNKVLFDFADIESYDPDGNAYLDRWADDGCYYDGGNWAEEWCAVHPNSELCAYCDCAHSHPLNCNQKSRAFWWMMARLAGWEPDQSSSRSHSRPFAGP